MTLDQFRNVAIAGRKSGLATAEIAPLRRDVCFTFERDIGRTSLQVRLVPQADVCAAPSRMRAGSSKWTDHRVVKGGDAPIVAIFHENANTQLLMCR